jgi:hypothetical protein
MLPVLQTCSFRASARDLGCGVGSSTAVQQGGAEIRTAVLRLEKRAGRPQLTGPHSVHGEAMFILHFDPATEMSRRGDRGG